MNKKFDNILLGTLWLLAATLGTTFWFNTRFGFNLFSGAHWDYLATQQASREPVSFWFYFSFVAATFITLFVLYLLIKPRRRNITITEQQKPASNTAIQPVVTPAPPSPAVAQPVTNNDASQINIIPGTTQATHTQTPNVPPAPYLPPRPPRLNITPASTMAGAQPTPAIFAAPTQSQPVATPTSTMSVPQSTTSHKQEWPEIREIFSMAGYVIKPEPFINGHKMALFAIGTDEVLWMGAAGMSVSDMDGCVNKMHKIFHDTLDGIEITVKSFVLNPTAKTPDSNTLTFDSVEELRKYMNEHRNPPLDADDAENFTAYSEYITTVIEYIGQM